MEVVDYPMMAMVLMIYPATLMYGLIVLKFDTTGTLGFSGLVDWSYELNGVHFSALTWAASILTVGTALVLTKLWGAYQLHKGAHVEVFGSTQQYARVVTTHFKVDELLE